MSTTTAPTGKKRKKDQRKDDEERLEKAAKTTAVQAFRIHNIDGVTDNATDELGMYVSNFAKHVAQRAHSQYRDHHHDEGPGDRVTPQSIREAHHAIRPTGITTCESFSINRMCAGEINVTMSNGCTKACYEFGSPYDAYSMGLSLIKSAVVVDAMNAAASLKEDTELEIIGEDISGMKTFDLMDRLGERLEEDVSNDPGFFEDIEDILKNVPKDEDDEDDDDYD